MYALCGMQYDGEEEESQKNVNSDHDDKVRSDIHHHTNYVG